MTKVHHTSLGKKGIKLACVTEVQEDLKHSGLYLELLKVTRIISPRLQLCSLSVCLSNAQRYTCRLTSVDSAGAAGRQPPFCRSTRVVSLSDLVTYVSGPVTIAGGEMYWLAWLEQQPRLLSTATGNRWSEIEEIDCQREQRYTHPKSGHKHALCYCQHLPELPCFNICHMCWAKGTM